MSKFVEPRPIVIRKSNSKLRIVLASLFALMAIIFLIIYFTIGSGIVYFTSGEVNFDFDLYILGAFFVCSFVSLIIYQPYGYIRDDYKIPMSWFGK